MVRIWVTTVTSELQNVANKCCPASPAALPPPFSSPMKGFKEPLTKKTADRRPANQRAALLTHPLHAYTPQPPLTQCCRHLCAPAASAVTHPPTCWQCINMCRSQEPQTGKWIISKQMMVKLIHADVIHAVPWKHNIFILQILSVIFFPYSTCLGHTNKL